MQMGFSPWVGRVRPHLYLLPVSKLAFLLQKRLYVVEYAGFIWQQ